MEEQVVFLRRTGTGTGIQNQNCNVKKWKEMSKYSLIFKMNYTLTKSNILGNKEVDFDSICTNSSR
jgi:hypothetical protein